MKFKTEDELVNVLKEKLKSNYSRDSVELFEEVSLGYGVADIVICDINIPVSNEIRSQESLNRSDINIYSIINRNKSVSFDKIYDTTRSSKKAISDSLTKLVNRKYVLQIENQFQVDEEYKLFYKNNFAIEAKLRNWKRALYQAYRYKWFADFSFVVLDAYYAEQAIENLDLFQRYNIGLATINTEGEFNRVFNPYRQKPFDVNMQILLSEMILNDYTVFK